ncbi:MAG: hypothetical protein RL385_3367 [Pseudomonadota bacterium]|jgi:hypothetical protein
MKYCLSLGCCVLLAACAASDDGAVSVEVTDGGAGSTPSITDAGGFVSTDASRPSASTGNVDASVAVPEGDLGCTKMDVLFVIDNSASMAQEQSALVESFPRMVQVLDALREGKVDYRVGVTTTSFGIAIPGLFELPSDDGMLLKTQDMQQPFLSRGDADLTARFSALAAVGVEGNANEQPIKAATAAVTSRVTDGKNAGFRRADALLAVVMITDEDDGSAEGNSFGIPGAASTPVADYKAKLDTAAGGPGRWAAAVIAGAQAGGCESSYGDAADAERLREFVGLLGRNGLMGDICSGNLAGELSKALDTFTSACEDFEPLR